MLAHAQLLGEGLKLSSQGQGVVFLPATSTGICRLFTAHFHEHPRWEHPAFAFWSPGLFSVIGRLSLLVTMPGFQEVPQSCNRLLLPCAWRACLRKEAGVPQTIPPQTSLA